MTDHEIISLVIFFGVFLLTTTLLHVISKRITSFPYSVALLVGGIVAQYVTHAFDIHVGVELLPSLIFFLLLPILLFEAAMHITIHQFRLQFRTISFLATIGLFLSISLIGVGVAYVTGMPLSVGFLFGAMISATDPIAVLSIFKSLGAPKRLGLIADGESMFNDAAAVIAFRVISSFVFIESFAPTKLALGFGNFVFVFLASIAFGAVVAFFSAYLVSLVKKDSPMVITITIALALLSFSVAEHFLHISGVISTVIAGLVFGNFGTTKLPSKVTHMVHELWEYLSYIAISLVFFFATFSLDFAIFTIASAQIAAVIIVILIARAISVYTSFFITNRSRLFRNEPNVPLSWQHVINWGGLRGVIPLVLVYTLPEEFIYRNELIAYTLATFLASLFINGLTIKPLLISLKLHLPRKEEELHKEEMIIFQIEQAKKYLKTLPEHEFDSTVVQTFEKQLNKDEEQHKNYLLQLATPEEFQHSIEMQSLLIEQQALQELFDQGHIPESVYYEFLGELELQQDALEFPELQHDLVIDEAGRVNTHRSFRKRLRVVQELICQYPLLRRMAKISQEKLVEERAILLKTRILTSEHVLEYLTLIARFIKHDRAAYLEIEKIKMKYKQFIAENEARLEKIASNYPSIIQRYQERYLNTLVQNHVQSSTPFSF